MNNNTTFRNKIPVALFIIIIFNHYEIKTVSFFVNCLHIVEIFKHSTLL